MPLKSSRAALFATLFASVVFAPPGLAQQPEAPVHPGKTLLLGKCAQCHADNIWRDQRQDARAWEATLYRMMGRGAVWTGDEIKTMAEYLSIDFGSNTPRAKPATR